jgi:hypothetical protein
LVPAEKWLLVLILRGGDAVGAALDALRETDLAPLRTASLLRAAKALRERGAPPTLGAIEAAVTSDEERRLLREIAVEAPPVEQADPLDCVRELRRLSLKQRLARIQGELAKAQGQELQTLLQEKLEISRQMAGL